MKRRPNTAPVALVPDLRRQIREGLIEAIRGAVSATAHQLVEDEGASLVGEPGSRKGDSPPRRNGAAITTIHLDGEPHWLTRARVRDQDAGSEHPLQSLRALRNHDPLDEVEARLAWCAVSAPATTRALRPTSRMGWGSRRALSAPPSSVQRARASAPSTTALAEWSVCALYIGGTGFADHTAVLALGVEKDGTKHLLGVVEGASENAEVVRGLLEYLVDRGLDTTARVLFVLDGSKALRKAVRDVFGARAVVQRCLVHKLRNLLRHLSPSREAEAGRRLKAA